MISFASLLGEFARAEMTQRHAAPGRSGEHRVDSLGKNRLSAKQLAPRQSGARTFSARLITARIGSIAQLRCYGRP